MKTCTASHRELTLLLEGLRKIGVNINEDVNHRVYIRENWQYNDGEVMFDAKPVGRKGDEIYYSIQYDDQFNSLIGTGMKELN